jgi:Na+/H+ antiporter NhaD/arsenite permease-like protein
VTWQAITSLAIFAVAFILIATETVHRTAVALAGAAAMVVLGFVPGEEVFYSHHTGVDWNVIFLLLGMMIIVGVIKHTGVFEFLGVWAAQRSKGRPYRLLVLLMGITALASPFLDNVTTVMLVAPVTVAVCRRLDISPAPYLIAEVLASNIGGAATLIGDPPNIIIASRAGLSFNDFLIHMTPIVALLFALFVVMARFLFRKSFVYHPEKVAQVMAMDARASITDARKLVRCLIVLGLVMVMFTLHAVLHLEPAVVALLGAGAIVLVSRDWTNGYLKEVEWSTLVFFMGLFVMVGALVNTGIIGAVGEWAVRTVGDNYLGAATSLLFGSAVVGAVFDNIPYAATMAPIVEGLAAQTTDPTTSQALWWSFALGADLSGNGTAIAASANVVVLGIAAREKVPITFGQFTKYGAITTLATTLVAWVYVWLRYFVLG